MGGNVIPFPEAAAARDAASKTPNEPPEETAAEMIGETAVERIGQIRRAMFLYAAARMRLTTAEAVRGFAAPAELVLDDWRTVPVGEVLGVSEAGAVRLIADAAAADARFQMEKIAGFLKASGFTDDEINGLGEGA